MDTIEQAVTQEFARLGAKQQTSGRRSVNDRAVWLVSGHGFGYVPRQQPEALVLGEQQAGVNAGKRLRTKCEAGRIEQG